MFLNINLFSLQIYLILYHFIIIIISRSRLSAQGYSLGINDTELYFLSEETIYVSIVKNYY